MTFTADFRHPEKPVTFVGARITGVRKAVAEHLYGRPLDEFGVPVRASGLLGGPSVSITVVRNEAGDVAYTDNTTVEWAQATWLARKAGVLTNGTPADGTSRRAEAARAGDHENDHVQEDLGDRQ